MLSTHYIEFLVPVRHPEDATVNGQEDKDGTLMPLNEGWWQAQIELKTGIVKGWPEGQTASIYYKVCDSGEYWLTDHHGSRFYKWKDHYVPDAILCVGETGFGDYVGFDINEEGIIEGWEEPLLKESEWTTDFISSKAR